MLGCRYRLTPRRSTPEWVKMTNKSDKKPNPARSQRGTQTSTALTLYRPPRPAAPAPVARAMQVHRATVHHACALTNPFCESSVGSRWPDDSYTKSVGWSVTNYPKNLDTTAAGSAMRIYFPDQGAPYADASGIAGTVGTFAGAYSMQSSPPANGVRFRITSWGLRIYSTLSPMNAQGVVRVRLLSPQTGSTLGTVDGATSLADACYDIPIARLLQQDFFVIPAPLGTNARFFRDTTSSATIASWQNPGWQVVVLSVFGAPASTTAIFVNAFYNYEYVFADGDASTAFARAPPANSPLVRSVSATLMERIGNFATGTISALDKAYQTTAGRIVMGAAANALLGPAASSALAIAAAPNVD